MSCSGSTKPHPAELLREAQAIAQRDRPRPGLGIRARGANSGSPIWRATTSAPRPTLDAAGRGAAPPVRGAALLPPRSARAASARRPRRSCRRRCSASRRRSRSPRRSTPGPASSSPARCPRADPRAALPHPVQARQERARIQGGGRGRDAHAAPRRSTCCNAAGAIDSPVPVPLAPLPVRELPQGHRLPAAAGAGDQGDAAAGRRAARSRSTTRRRPRSTMRCRCRAWARGTRDASASTSRRRRSAFAAGDRRSTRSRASGCRRSTCPATRSRCCPTTWCRRTRWPKAANAPAVSLYVHVRRSHAGRSRRARRALERVPIAANLRHDLLDERRSPKQTLADRTPAPAARVRRASWRSCIGLAQQLKARREAGARQARERSTGPTTTSASIGVGRRTARRRARARSRRAGAARRST